ncbi:Post-GPI attachment to proteins factor 3 [Cucumispora dikerogammari]|nr:Post-GPI attachment to proteins factor 3 [Cucumispora dikerogammari]
MYLNTIKEIANDKNKRTAFFNSLNNCLLSPFIIKETNLDRLFGRTELHKHRCKCLYETLNKHKLGNFKYNGRYVFLSFMGCYEFFSVLFSFMSTVLVVARYIRHNRVVRSNINTSNTSVVTTGKCLVVSDRLNTTGICLPEKSQNSYSPHDKQLFPFTIINNTGHIDKHIYFILTIITGLASVALHVHENHWTQRGDYLCAMLSIIFASNLFLQRTKTLLNHTSKLYNFFKNLSTFIFIYVLYDQYYSDNFDAVLNKVISGSFIIIMLINFIIHFIKQKCHSKKYHLFLMSLFLSVSLVFEFVDMPPVLYLVDSHAMWHLCLFLCVHHITEYLILDV